jgi:phenylalanyl-tRNA synthetase beta chain
MKFTLSWLKDHLETTETVAALVERMTMIGIEVEDVENLGDKLKAFSVARIKEAAPHPNADKLRVCQVETKDGMKEIVCGAPNARQGLVTIYAPIGAIIPASGLELVEKPVRGVVSNGMLCSGAELEVDGESDGILELPYDLKVGAPAAEALGVSDVVFDIEVTPNRPDWLGVNGVARDLAAAGLGKFITRAIAPPPARFNAPLKVETDDAKACPVFAARYIRGVKNGPSPEWMQQRLKAVGIKPRSMLVDVTNYLSLDRARPLHVYDADKLKGAVRARLGRIGESFVALDGKRYEVTPSMCVIADDACVLGLSGIMGGEETGCSDRTVNVLIESALFDPLRIFQTGRATGINSDARYRFERGVDPSFVVPGVDLAARMILEQCGGECSDLLLAGQAPSAPGAIAFDPDRVRTLAGVSVTQARARTILKALGFAANPEPGGGKTLVVKPPSWRRDVEGSADLVEEIARIEGFDKLPLQEPPRAPGYRSPPAGVGESRLRIARRALAASGYFECVTWSFCPRGDAEAFGLRANAIAPLTLSNPIASDLEVMRPTPLANLIRAAQRNRDRGQADARLFEAGPGYRGDGENNQARLVSAIWQAAPKRHWRSGPSHDVFDVKRDLMAALEAIGAPVASLQAGLTDVDWLHPGRGGILKLGPKPVARFGEIHPRVLQALDAEGPIYCFEIDVDALPAARAKPTRAKPALAKSDLMPLSRDFAFLVKDSVAAADLARAAYGADKELITDVTLFDVYRGAGVPDGEKSLAIEVTLQPKEKTLTDTDIEAVSAKIISAAAKAVGARLRV